MTRQQLEARNAAIRKAWEDPLLRALHSALMSKPGSQAAKRPTPIFAPIDAGSTRKLFSPTLGGLDGQD